MEAQPSASKSIFSQYYLLVAHLVIAEHKLILVLNSETKHINAGLSSNVK